MVIWNRGERWCGNRYGYREGAGGQRAEKEDRGEVGVRDA